MSNGVLGPRVVIAGTHSGVGKTTVTVGLLAALRRAGHHPSAAKVGPDFIDPGYHALACGRPPRNLDPWLCGPQAIGPLAVRAATGSDVLVVEGVMGMFDGSADSMPSSTADVARLLAAPVILVVDASAMSSSVAALVHGYSTLRPDVGVSAVVLNQVGSHGHELLLREALASLGVSVVGALPRDDSLSWRDRHLGLVPVAEQPESVAKSLDRLAATVSSHVDLEAVLALARSAPPARFGSVALPAFHTAVRIGVASGKAFSFTYTDTVEALEAAGAEVVPFDPLAERSLPEALDGVIIGGGFPEVHAAELADNRPLLDDLCARIASGMPTWAECGGLLLLCQSLDGHRMAGILPARAQMTAKLTLGYRLARTTSASPVGPSGTPMRGHEFHYSELDRPGAAMLLESRWGTRPEGWASPKMLATYLHHHPGGDPGRVAAFVATAARASEPAAD